MIALQKPTKPFAKTSKPARKAVFSPLQARKLLLIVITLKKFPICPIYIRDGDHAKRGATRVAFPYPKGIKNKSFCDKCGKFNSKKFI
jgi:hypothetical protein